MPRVLIVDDDRFTRTVLETVLAQEKTFRDLGVTVESAADGEQALAVFRANRPDLVITDLLMPRVDGFALCKAIRDEPGGDAVHLVVMSAIYRDASIAQRVRNEYRAEFFAKPYQLRDMTERAARLLGDGSHAAASPPPEAAPQAGVGQLGDRRLPALLLDLLDDRATGRLTVRRGAVTKTVELVVGHPAAVDSSLRDETLGHYLQAMGAITEEQHRRAVQRAARSEARLGEALIALGLLTPEVLLEHLTGQMRHKLVRMLRWPDGSWQFEPNVAPSAPRGNPLDPIATILLGLRDTGNLAAVPEYLAHLEGRPLHLTERGQRLLPQLGRHLGLSLDWREGATVAELTRAGGERSDAIAALDVLWMCGGLEAADTAGDAIDAATSDQFPTISVTELSEHSQLARLPVPPPPPTAGEDDGDRLYAMLFDEGNAAPALPIGDQPIDLSGVPEMGDDADSGVIDVRDIHAGGPAEGEGGRARRRILEEYLRIQGLDHYGVIGVPPTADAATISAAVVDQRQRFSMDWFARFDLGRDYGKLEEIHAAYDRAFAVLMDEPARAAYDRGVSDDSLDGGAAPGLETEMAFAEGERLLATGDLPAAIATLRTVVAAAPNEATYRAVLGWAVFVDGKRTPRAADEARTHLNQALALDPDHGRAHEYKGLIGVEIASDDVEARFHLERALDADPTSVAALAGLEKIWARRGEARPMERLYRRLIYRVAGRDAGFEATLWSKLGELYRSQLEDRDSARVAFGSAARLRPNDAAAQAALADLDSGTAERFYERSEMLREHWRRDPSVAGPGLELVRAAEQAGRHDAAFMAASALVARGLANPPAEELYRRFRPRFLQRAQGEIGPGLWDKLRHPDDSRDIGVLFELIAPALREASPLTLADLDIDDSARLEEERLPEGLVAVRAYLAHTLGLPVPPVYVRSDFGRQVHVAAVEPPVLLAGDAALAAPERAELAFRLGRAMTYLWPGRAIGGSRPSRFLRSAVLAAWLAVDPTATVDDPDGSLAELRTAIRQLGPGVLRDLQGLVGTIVRHSRTLNLSRWARGLARTADRVGLLVCGDLPAAVRFAADSGVSDAADELIDFAIGAPHLSLRARLGLSIDV